MISHIKFSPEAEKDFSEILINLGRQDSVASAKKLIRDFKNQLNDLASSSVSGRIGVCEKTREVVLVGLPFIVIFSKENSSVTVLRILHGAYERRQAQRDSIAGVPNP